MRPLLLFLLALAPACATVPRPTPTTTAAATPTAGPPKVVLLHLVRKLGNEPIANVAHALLTLPANPAAADTLSAKWQAEAAREADEFVAGYREAVRNGDAGLAPWSLDVTVKVPTLHEDLVVLVRDVSVYTGGAHPNHHTEATTHRLRDDAFVPVSFAEAFVPDAAATLDAPIVEALRAQEAGWVTDGTLTSVATMLHTWWPEKDGLHVVFDPYEAGPYVEGPHEVVLPWSTVAPTILPDGPLRRFRPG